MPCPQAMCHSELAGEEVRLTRFTTTTTRFLVPRNDTFPVPCRVRRHAYGVILSPGAKNLVDAACGRDASSSFLGMTRFTPI